MHESRKAGVGGAFWRPLAGSVLIQPNAGFTMSVSEAKTQLSAPLINQTPKGRMECE